MKNKFYTHEMSQPLFIATHLFFIFFNQVQVKPSLTFVDNHMLLLPSPSIATIPSSSSPMTVHIQLYPRDVATTIHSHPSILYFLQSSIGKTFFDLCRYPHAIAAISIHCHNSILFIFDAGPHSTIPTSYRNHYSQPPIYSLFSSVKYR